MTLERICMNCKWWERTTDLSGYDKNGDCKNDHFVYAGEGDKAPVDGLQYWDYESYSAGFETGEKFGCIHFEAKENES